MSQSDAAGGNEAGDSGLTDREHQTLRLAARGMSNAEIATAMSVSIRTVQAHLTQTFGKLGVGSRIEAVIAGLRSGLLSMQDLDDD